MQDNKSNRPCPKCGQPIPIGVSVCYHCQHYLGLLGWLTSMNIMFGFLVTIVSVYSAFQTGANRQAVETALEQSKIMLREIKLENTLQRKSNVAQRWDIFRIRRTARVNSCQLELTNCEFLMSQEVQDFYLFVKVLAQHFEDLSNSERTKYCGSAIAEVTRSNKQPLSQESLQIFPSLQPTIENICNTFTKK